MNITANFNSYSEMKDFARNLLGISSEEIIKIKSERLITTDTIVEPEEERKPKKVKKVTKEVKTEISEEPAEAPKVEAQPTTISLETVRAVLAKINKGGKQEKVKELISSFGGKKLTDIPPDRYKELLEKAEEL